MTKRKMLLIINEIVGTDKLTGAEFVNRLCVKIVEQPTLRKSKPYMKVLKKWLKKQAKKSKDIIFEL